MIRSQSHALNAKDTNLFSLYIHDSNLFRTKHKTFRTK